MERLRLRWMFVLMGVLASSARAAEQTAAPAILQVTPVHRETPAAWHAIATLGQAYPPVDIVADGSDQKPTLDRTPQGGVVLGVPAFTGRPRDVVLQILCGTQVQAAPTRIKLRYRFLNPERLPNLASAMVVPNIQVGQMSYGFSATEPGRRNMLICSARGPAPATSTPTRRP